MPGGNRRCHSCIMRSGSSVLVVLVRSWYSGLFAWKRFSMISGVRSCQRGSKVFSPLRLAMGR